MRPAAVDPGADATRLVVPGPDGRAEPVTVLPSGTTAAAALDALVGRVRGPVALVHPPDVGPATALAGLAGDVRPVAAPVAVLAGRPGRWLVVDAGRSGTTITLVDGGCVRSTVRVAVGGDRLDDLLASATGCPRDRVRPAREALSCAARVDVPGHGPMEAATVDAVLRPAFDDVVAQVPDAVAPVVLCGGLARTPLLAAMLDERAGHPVRLLPEPELAAVRGALETVPAGSGPEPSRDAVASAGRARRPVLRPAAAVLGLLLVGAGTAAGAVGDPTGPPGPPAPSASSLVQYGYTVAVPPGWAHAGGDPQRRRTLLTRTASPDGVELVSVERSPLGYDAGTEPDRARADLVAAHGAVGDLGPLRPDTVAGRAVTRYRQPAGPDAVVDWVVLFEGTDELAVGCRRPARTAGPGLEPVCVAVVASVRVVG